MTFNKSLIYLYLAGLLEESAETKQVMCLLHFKC